MISPLRIPQRGWGLLAVVGVLCGMSLLTMQALFSLEPTRVPADAAIKQLAFGGAGLLAVYGILVIGYQRLGRVSFFFFGVCVLLLAGLRLDTIKDVSFITVRNGARRWIDIGPVQIQPSELMKIAYVLVMAWYLRFRRDHRKFGGLLGPFALTLVPMVLILVQPDLGTVLLFLPVLFAMLFAAGARAKHLLAIIMLGGLCMPLFWMHIQDYQRLRLVGMVLQSPAVRQYFATHPERWQAFKPPRSTAAEWRNQLTEWETRAGFQVVHGKTAIGSGGVRGEGWAKGIFVDNEFLLPERENDFVFAMIAHQWGLLGGLVLLACYFAIVVLGFDIATRTKDPFGQLVAVGVSTLLGVQALINLCMTVGIGPVTGITLPFVSKGGSSLVASFICIGLLISVAQRRPPTMAKRSFEFNEEAGM